MGASISNTQPQLDRDIDYTCFFLSYAVECGVGGPIFGFTIKNGGVVQDWLDDGNNWKEGEGIFSLFPNRTDNLLSAEPA